MKVYILSLIALSSLLPLKSQGMTFKSSGESSSLIELYSSEGCSSCPPAEAWMSGLKNTPGLWKDIFPVVFHVDYWDGLGWPDRFASNAFTRRQQTYADRFASDTVYTPEFIVNGREWHRTQLGEVEPPKTEAGKAGDLIVSVDKSQITAEYQPGSIAPRKALFLNVALLGFRLATDVKAGENGGRRLTHDFVALGFGSTPLVVQSDGSFRAPLAVKMTTVDDPGAIVAWVSTDDGSILQTTGGWLPVGTSKTGP